MKKLLFLFLLPMLFFSCSSDDNEPSQDYTSFVFMQDFTNVMGNVIIARKNNDKYYKLAELGDIKKDTPSKEVIIENKTITEVYIFSDYGGFIGQGIRTDYVFKISKNKKNILIIPNGTKGIGVSDKTDPTQYPQ